MSLMSNRSARYTYDILETFEAGIVLQGAEVRSIRLGHGRLDDSYAIVSSNNDVQLKNFFITPFQPQNPSAHFISDRPRTLLLNKKDISHIRGVLSQPGITLIPLSVYTKGRFIKIELALAKGRKKYDKRNVLKQRDASREIQRALKQKL